MKNVTVQRILLDWGFVRVTGSEIQTEGAHFIEAGAETGPVRFLPLQPVWPGIVFDGFLLGLVFLAADRLIKRRTRT